MRASSSSGYVMSRCNGRAKAKAEAAVYISFTINMNSTTTTVLPYFQIMFELLPSI